MFACEKTWLCGKLLSRLRFHNRLRSPPPHPHSPSKRRISIRHTDPPQSVRSPPPHPIGEVIPHLAPRPKNSPHQKWPVHLTLIFDSIGKPPRPTLRPLCRHLPGIAAGFSPRGSPANETGLQP